MNELVQALSEKFNLPINAVWADFDTILQRFIKYETIKSFAIAAIFLVLAAVGVYLLKILVNDYKKCEKLKSNTTFFEYECGSIWPSVECVFIIAFIIVALIFGSLMGIVGILEGTKWILIPEIQIVEWLGQ